MSAPDLLVSPWRRHRSNGRCRQLRDGRPQFRQLRRDDVVQLSDRRNEMPLRLIERALFGLRWRCGRGLEPA